MTTTTEPPKSAPSEFETQVLFPEARRRRHRRWSIGIALLAAVVVAVALLVSSSSKSSPPSARHGGLTRWTPSGRRSAAPATFVAGDGRGGVGLYSTNNGHLIRTLSPQGAGGPDQQIVLTRDRASVYFVQPSGSCSGKILTAPISGAAAPTVVISDPGNLPLAPSPSPSSGNLAWVGVTCDVTGSTTSASLYVTDVTTHATSDLGAYSGQPSDDQMAWSPNGQKLAVQNDSTVEIIDVTRQSAEAGLSLRVGARCRLASPVFVTQERIAAIRTCFGPTGIERTSNALVFDIATGTAVALIATAPTGSSFQGLSADSSGQHILLGLANSGSAENVQVEGGRLVIVSRRAPTDAQW
jgi:dipeptidyl aminopeptidase/acylaminoacyl peptidase